MHLSAVYGKQITQAHYGSPHKKSYYLGCSTGGRQGMKAAQSFPEDFHGIVAGAPAFDFNSLISVRPSPPPPFHPAPTIFIDQN